MKLIIANLKMYLNTLNDVQRYKKDMYHYKDSFIVAPQSIYLEDFVNSGFVVSAQNVSDEDSGPYTGEISPMSLADMNVEYVMIGHCEIRKKYVDEKKYIFDKVSKAIDNNLKVILCIGEDKDENVYEVIDNELKDIVPNDNLIISYEPMWAIGNNNIPKVQDLKKIVCYIKDKGYKKVLYGGSVNENNIYELNSIGNIDGFLIGSCALKTDSFKKIIEVVR